MRQRPEPPPALAAARRRARLRARVEICAGLRRRWVSSAVGAAGAAALRLGEEAAAELALIPDTPELRRLDAALLARPDGAAGGEEATIRRLVEEYRQGRALDLFTASPTELLAGCIARLGGPGTAIASESCGQG
jgi:hypothetical protein